MSVPDLSSEMEDLSFAARAVLATVTALTYEFQESEIAVRVVKRMLGLSDDAWEAAYAELHEACSLYRVGDRAIGVDLVEVRQAGEILRQAIGAGGRPSVKEWRELRDRVLEEHGERCFYCEAEGGPLEIDHVQPVTRGGSNHFANLVPACKSCNSAKGNKTWEEWYPVWARVRG